jgi:hypothetical protein
MEDTAGITAEGGLLGLFLGDMEGISRCEWLK